MTQPSWSGTGKTSVICNHGKNIKENWIDQIEDNFISPLYCDRTKTLAMLYSNYIYIFHYFSDILDYFQGLMSWVQLSWSHKPYVLFCQGKYMIN